MRHLLVCALLSFSVPVLAAPPDTAKVEAELAPKLDDAGKARLARGLKQAASLWRESDGDFAEFAKANFAMDPATLDGLFERYQDLLEQIDGHMDLITVSLKKRADLDIGTMLPVDETFAGYDASAHVTEDFFGNKLAFVALLNFPLTTLDERLEKGPKWTRREWAEARLTSRFSKRVPADVSLAIAEAYAQADHYIADYNIWMHHVVGPKGERLFPPKKRLLSHWNLRDEIKASYGEPATALPKQRLILKVMERIVTQTIPAAVVNKPHLDWDPVANTVKASPAAEDEETAPADLKEDASPEPDRRY
ncbi:MAG: hypothetical protein HY925_16560, partial [Elusimicrobia bacterium]|nr:hypothetical protein [Elusimicrobiota bacterium]